jgi:hypothetical protein
VIGNVVTHKDEGDLRTSFDADALDVPVHTVTVHDRKTGAVHTVQVPEVKFSYAASRRRIWASFLSPPKQSVFAKVRVSLEFLDHVLGSCFLGRALASLKVFQASSEIGYFGTFWIYKGKCFSPSMRNI